MSKTITRTVRTSARVFAAAGLAVAALATGTTGAHASTSVGYVNTGWGDYRTDWADEGLISTTQHSRSGAAGLWQTVLWLDGYLAESDVDCQFGPKTQAATKAWQARYLGASEADGVVGPKTFGRASQNLMSTDNGFSIQYRSKYLGRDKYTGRYFFDTAYTRGFVNADYNSSTNCR
ncbi:peptidoglycan-binding domain-containing protein [Kitasatospora purpeofusca]|uniref:peptidoglycan-binding domain-containing protein n=1 Tax=Kitasatospora purpeofusca TaxID=67352 RepID=UPI003F4AA873